MQFSEKFRRWLKSFTAALAEGCAAPDSGDAVEAVPVAARRLMSAYDSQNEIRRVRLRRRSIPSIASRARVKVTKITNNDAVKKRVDQERPKVAAAQ